jgi:hypothetical protein
VIHTLTLAWTRNGETITKGVNLNIEGEQNIDVVVGGGVSNKQVLATIDVSALALVYITSDQDVLIETNNSSSPAEAINISADKPLIWYLGCAWANPFATDVTALYLTRASGDAANVQIRYGYDATP